MDVRISLADHDVDELHSLWNWFGDEPRVRRFGQPRRAISPAEQEMGSAFEAISLTIGAGLSVAQLVVALLAWRDSQKPRHVIIVLERGGVRAVLDGSDPEDTIELLTTDGADALVQPER